MTGTEPDVEDILQEEEPRGLLVVPTRIVESGPIRVQLLPGRDGSMGAVAVTQDVVQHILGTDPRRKKVTIWATSATATGILYVGTDKNAVESLNSAQIPAVVDTYADGLPFKLEMTHCQGFWVKNTTANTMTLSYVAEYWAE